MNEPTMMLVQATWNEKQTFRMIPITVSCPYVECIMDPETQVFVIISKINKTKILQFVNFANSHIAENVRINKEKPIELQIYYISL